MIPTRNTSQSCNYRFSYQHPECTNVTIGISLWIESALGEIISNKYVIISLLEVCILSLWAMHTLIISMFDSLVSLYLYDWIFTDSFENLAACSWISNWDLLHQVVFFGYFNDVMQRYYLIFIIVWFFFCWRVTFMCIIISIKALYQHFIGFHLNHKHTVPYLAMLLSALILYHLSDSKWLLLLNPRFHIKVELLKITAEINQAYPNVYQPTFTLQDAVNCNTLRWWMKWKAYIWWIKLTCQI